LQIIWFGILFIYDLITIKKLKINIKFLGYAKKNCPLVNKPEKGKNIRSLIIEFGKNYCMYFYSLTIAIRQLTFTVRTQFQK